MIALLSWLAFYLAGLVFFAAYGYRFGRSIILGYKEGERQHYSRFSCLWRGIVGGLGWPYLVVKIVKDEL